MATPLNETSVQIFTEKAFLQGTVLTAVAYGAQLPLFMMTFWLLWKKKSGTPAMQKYALLVFISVLFILGTLFMASDAQFTQLAFIDDRNFPGGPGAYSEVEFTIPIDELGNVCAMISTWLCDGLLVWRFYIIFNSLAIPRYYVMILPSLLWLGSFVTGIMWLLQDFVFSPWSSAGAINWTIPFFSLSLSLNILLTIAIVLRLLLFRRHIVSVLGQGHGRQYTSVAAMIVESASIFSVFSLLFLVPFALNNPLNGLFFSPLGGVQVIATYLIIFRVAQGKCWNVNTATTQHDMSSIRVAVRGSRETPSSSKTLIQERRIGISTSAKGSSTAVVALEQTDAASSYTGFNGSTKDQQEGVLGQDLEMATISVKNE